MDILNLMGGGDTSHLSFNDIREFCKKYSKQRKNPRDVAARITKLAGGGIIWSKIGNLLDHLKLIFLVL
jgi:hypothetical protein